MTYVYNCITRMIRLKWFLEKELMVLWYFPKVAQMHYKEDERLKKEIWTDAICNDV